MLMSPMCGPSDFLPVHSISSLPLFLNFASLLYRVHESMDAYNAQAHTCVHQSIQDLLESTGSSGMWHNEDTIVLRSTEERHTA